MNDVKLSQEWAQQWDNTTYIEGVEGLDTDAVIVLVRGETGLGEDTWYQECIYDVNITDSWSSIKYLLNDDDSGYITGLWNESVENLNSDSSTTAEYVVSFSVIEALYQSDNVPEGEDAQEVITEALEELINIDLEAYSYDTDTTLDYIGTVITLVELMTNDTELIESNSTILTDIIGYSDTDGWLLVTLELTLRLLENSSSDSAETAELVQTIGTNADNAVENIYDAVIDLVNATGTVQQLIENMQTIMEFELEHAWEDEVIINKRNNITTFGQTVINGMNCSSPCTEIVIPNNNAGQSDDDTICVTTCNDNDEVSVNLKQNGTKVYKTTNDCFPFLIIMSTTNAFDKALEGEWEETLMNYPKCVWFNRSTDAWDGTGCVVFNFTENTVTCACTHLTTFKIAASDFDPKADMIDVNDVRVLNTKNLLLYPTTWITMLVISVILIVACILVPNNSNDIPIIAFEDIIYKQFRDQYAYKHQQWREIQQIDRWYTKIGYLERTSSLRSLTLRKKTPSRYYWLLSWNLFQIYLKNEHTLLSVLQRTDGTNLSTKQRIGLFLLYMYMVMMATAIFYGSEGERQIMGDIAASALISLIATVPVKLIRTLFQKSKPEVVSSKIGNQTEMEMVEVKSISIARSDDDVHSATPDSPNTNDETVQLSELTLEEAQKDGDDTYWNAVTELKESSRPDMKLVAKCMSFVNLNSKSDDTTEKASKAALADEVRLILLDSNYKLPQCCKNVAWILTIAMSVVCVVISVSYGIQFDIGSDKYEAWINAKRSFEESASNSSDCSFENDLKFHIKEQLYDDNIERIQADQEANSEPGNFEGVSEESIKWILDVVLSLLTSMFIWQPLSIYQLTWLKIWAFQHGLIMEASIYNWYRLLCCCCDKSEEKQKLMITNVENNKKGSHVAQESDMYEELSVSGSSRFANENRALDLIGFLGNDDLFVELPDDYGHGSN